MAFVRGGCLTGFEVDCGSREARIRSGPPVQNLRRGIDPTPRRNARKVFILFELGKDFGFRVIGKVLILLGFGVGDVSKVFISNK